MRDRAAGGKAGDRAEPGDRARLRTEPQKPLPLRRMAASPDLRVWWLGQAGFLVECAGIRLLVDPYLSDSLGQKYRGTRFPHVRMADIPVHPAELCDIDLVLSTHGHGDHLDPGSLGPLAVANPECHFIVPASCAAKAIERGVPRDRLIGADAFASLSAGEATIHPIPSAHESLEIDEAGHHRFLGYVIELGSWRLFHAGDACPYPGLLANLAPYAIDLALLPVNGRDDSRRLAGIAGNFSLDEALSLARDAGFAATLGHHFGMFAFNTIDPAEARNWLAAHGSGSFILAEAGACHVLGASPESGLGH